MLYAQLIQELFLLSRKGLVIGLSSFNKSLGVSKSFLYDESTTRVRDGAGMIFAYDVYGAAAGSLLYQLVEITLFALVKG